MTTIIARIATTRDEQMTASEARDRILAYDATYKATSQVRVAYDLKAGAYRVWATPVHMYTPATPGYQSTQWGCWHTTVSVYHLGRLDIGSRSTPAYDRHVEELADIEADRMTARAEEELDAYLASLE